MSYRDSSLSIESRPVIDESQRFELTHLTPVSLAGCINPFSSAGSLAAQTKMETSLKTIGFNVYLWGQSSQDRFLSECLEPAFRKLHSDGVAERIWYDRMGTRGPHLFVLASVESSLSSGVASYLSSCIAGYLKERPSQEILTADELLQIHQDMKGKVFCLPDKLASLAQNNTFEAFEQREFQYPFSLMDEADFGCDIWPSLTNIYLWSLSCLQHHAPAALPQIAFAFAFLFSRTCLGDSSLSADYWKYHAETLLIGLDRIPLTTKTLPDVLPQLIGRKNLAHFEHAKQMFESASSEKELNNFNDFLPEASQVDGSLQVLKQYVCAARKQDQHYLPANAKVVIREILHTLFKQLGLRVPQHVPIVLFLWLTNLDETPKD